MSWAQIERSHYEKYKRDFVLCREPEERDFLIHAIVTTFTFIQKEEVERTFDHFCNADQQPLERELFMAGIREHLGKEITHNYVKRYGHF
jgi:hypothetical protein